MTDSGIVNTESGALKKALSITEDLRLKSAPPLATSKVGESSPLQDITEHDETVPSPTAGISSQVVRAAASSPAISKSSGPTSANVSAKTGDNGKPRHTLAEVTHDLKQQLDKTLDEIYKSDAEFDRLLGNLEKKLSSMRVKLTASATDK